jgi:predicted ATPase
VEILNGVQALRDHNLITQDDIDGEPRFTMLETIREYALEQLLESGEAEVMRQQHM